MKLITIGSKYFPRHCRVRAAKGFDGRYLISASQYRAAKKRCGITGADYLIRYGNPYGGALLVAGDNKTADTQVDWF